MTYTLPYLNVRTYGVVANISCKNDVIQFLESVSATANNIA